MGAHEETVVREFFDQMLVEQWDSALVERLVDGVAEGIRYHVYAWERPVVGKEAVREELLRQAPLFSEFRSEIVAMASQGNTVLMERRDSLRIGRKPLTQHAVSVFEVDAQGKIAVWRDYYDSVEFAMKLGIDVNKASTAGARGYDT